MKRFGQVFSYAANCIYNVNNIPWRNGEHSWVAVQERVECSGIPNSPNSIALQADYLTVVEDRSIMSAKYRLPVTFGQNCPKQQLHCLFAIAISFLSGFCDTKLQKKTYDLCWKLTSISRPHTLK